MDSIVPKSCQKDRVSHPIDALGDGADVHQDGAGPLGVLGAVRVHAVEPGTRVGECPVDTAPTGRPGRHSAHQSAPARSTSATCSTPS